MRILHLFNTAGVASQLSLFLESQGHQSQVLTTRRNNKFNHALPGAWVMSRARWFYLRALWEVHRWDAVLIHGNIKQTWLLPFTRSPLILYLHGSELRTNKKKVHMDLALGLYKHIFVATPDLLDDFRTGLDSVTYIPNPVHPMFKPGPPPPQERALAFKYGADQEAQDLARERGLELDLLPRTYLWPEMPGVLQKYSHFIDVKRDFRGEKLIKGGTLSLTALEALACGLTVVTEEGDLRGLPDKHRLENSGRIFLETLKWVLG